MEADRCTAGPLVGVGVYQDSEDGLAETLGLCGRLEFVVSGMTIGSFFSATFGTGALRPGLPEAIASNNSFSSYARIGKGLETWLLSMLDRARL